MTSPLLRRKALKASPTAATEGPTAPAGCAWCSKPLPSDHRGRFCSQRCRQIAWRLRHRPGTIEVIDATEAAPTRRRPMRFAYFDISALGPVVPKRLGADLRYLDGWAIAASPLALRELLRRFGGAPAGHRGAVVCAWTRAAPATTGATVGLIPCWEALIVRSPRKARGIPDALEGRLPALGHDGRQAVYGAWVIGLLGLMPGDQLTDRVGPDGVVARAWRELGGAAVEKIAALPPRRRRRRPPPDGPKLTPEPPAEVPAEPVPETPPVDGN